MQQFGCKSSNRSTGTGLVLAGEAIPWWLAKSPGCKLALTVLRAGTGQAWRKRALASDPGTPVSHIPLQACPHYGLPNVLSFKEKKNFSVSISRSLRPSLKVPAT